MSNAEGSPDGTKLIAMYFPQFHSIPENDEWWGTGFTDWVNVKAAKPQFPGHYQPRVPLNGDYYDQSKIETLHWQIDLAKKFGVYGFCHYHYWFDGKQLLQTPTNLVLENRDLDFPFCLSWANETWSRRWDGQDHHILIEQTHPPTKESWRAHFDYLIKAWTDPRAIRVEGKPVFVVYRPQRIKKIDRMLAYWRELALKEGLPGLFFVAQKQYEFPNRECLSSFDGVFQFQPFEAAFDPEFGVRSIRNTPWFKIVRALPESVQNMLRGLRHLLIRERTPYDYDTVWEHVVRIRPEQGLATFPGAFIDWDNTARYKKRATIYRGGSPERFKKRLRELVSTMPERGLPENFIFLNAWNEWAEGAYLEPDERYGYQYLEAVRDVLAGPAHIKFAA